MNKSTNTTTTKRTTTKPDTTTIDGVFTALVSGALTAHDAAIAADGFGRATVKRTASDTARTAWVIGMAADRQYVTDHGVPESNGRPESVVKVATHAQTKFGKSFEITTVRNAVSFARALASLNVGTMASFDALFTTFADRCADRKGSAFKSDPKLYKLHASQFMTFVGRLTQEGRIDADGVVRAMVKGSVVRATMANHRKSADASADAAKSERIATITTDGYKIGRVTVASVVMLSKSERADLALLLGHLATLDK